uniref:Amiloride-sensitive sodium channel n=1 Tax=Bursaphelenchus xylophilus TaxID=6326 RepID=A0A1I7SEQ0_BURXY
MNFVNIFNQNMKKRRRCYCRYFVGSELHGLKEAISTQNTYRHLGWSILLCVAVSIAIVNTIHMCADYYQNQLETSYSKHVVPRLEFPSVIICPKSPDALNFERVKKEITKVLPMLNDSQIIDLIIYAIGDTGLVNAHYVMVNKSEEHFAKFNRMIKAWRGRRDQKKFYEDLFEHHGNGYTCTQLFKECRLGALTINCCELFESHYVMLRGRCFRMKEFYQTDPGFYGRLYIGMNELPSLTAKDGKQVQLVAFLATPRSEISTFPRYYLTKQASTKISIKLRMFDMDPDFTRCHDDGETRGRAACYLRQWLYEKFVNPHNCTPFYMQYRTHGVDVCETGVIAKTYENVLDLATKENICMAACSRSEREYKVVRRNTEASRSLGFNETHPYRLELHYEDLEYENYAEVRITTLPGFVSQVGGQLGLFLGVTVMSIAQMILNLYVFLHERLQRLRKTLKTSQPPA